MSENCGHPRPPGQGAGPAIAERRRGWHLPPPPLGGRVTRMQLAAAMHRLGTESAFEVLARATRLAQAGKSIINLGIGQPDFPDAAQHRRGRLQGAQGRPPRLHPGQRHPAAPGGGGRGHASQPRRHGRSRAHRHRPGRQDHHGLRHDDVRRAGCRDHVPRPRLSHLSLDDRVHRRQGRPDRPPRVQGFCLFGRGGAGADHARAPASSSSTARPTRRAASCPGPSSTPS